MTIPIGHLDYQAYAQWRSPVFDSGVKNVTAAAPFVVHEDLPNFASLYMRFNQLAGVGVTVNLIWFTDATETILVDQDTWVIGGGLPTLSVFVPGKSNHFRLTASTAQAGTQQIEVFLAPSNIVAPAIRYPSTPNVIEGLAQNINGGATLTATMPQIMDGTGWVSVNVSGHVTGFNLAVQELNEAGNPVGTLFRQISTGPAINANFVAGPRAIQININNTDAAAHNFDYYMQILGV